MAKWNVIARKCNRLFVEGGCLISLLVMPYRLHVDDYPVLLITNNELEPL